MPPGRGSREPRIPLPTTRLLAGASLRGAGPREQQLGPHHLGPPQVLRFALPHCQQLTEGIGAENRIHKEETNAFVCIAFAVPGKCLVRPLRLWCEQTPIRARPTLPVLRACSKPTSSQLRLFHILCLVNNSKPT